MIIPVALMPGKTVFPYPILNDTAFVSCPAYTLAKDILITRTGRILTSNSPTNPNLRDHFVKDDHQTTSHVCIPLVLACLCRIMKYHPFPLVSGGGRAGTRQCRFCNSVEIEPLVLLSFDRQNDISKPEYTKHSQFFLWKTFLESY